MQYHCKFIHQCQLRLVHELITTRYSDCDNMDLRQLFRDIDTDNDDDDEVYDYIRSTHACSCKIIKFSICLVGKDELTPPYLLISPRLEYYLCVNCTLHATCTHTFIDFIQSHHVVIPSELWFELDAVIFDIGQNYKLSTLFTNLELNIILRYSHTRFNKDEDGNYIINNFILYDS